MIGKTALLKKCLFVCMLVVGSTSMISCESGSDSDDEGGVVFRNESARTVAVYWSSFNGDRPSTPSFILEPGDGETVENSISTVVYYWWSPENTVLAYQPAKDEIVFVDR